MRCVDVTTTKVTKAAKAAKRRHRFLHLARTDPFTFVTLVVVFVTFVIVIGNGDVANI